MVAHIAPEGVKAIRLLRRDRVHLVGPAPIKKASRADVVRSAAVYVLKPGQPFRERLSRLHDVLYLSETFLKVRAFFRRSVSLPLLLLNNGARVLGKRPKNVRHSKAPD